MVQDREQVSVCYEHGNEPSLFIQCRKLLDWLRNYELLREDSAVRIYFELIGYVLRMDKNELMQLNYKMKGEKDKGSIKARWKAELS